MDIDFDDSVARGLRRYAWLVGEALGQRGECSFVHAGEPASAYVAVEGRLAGYPGRDVALLWDERWGWATAVETHSGEDLLVVAHLGLDLLPDPAAVARWTRHVLRAGAEGDPSDLPVCDRIDVSTRLAAYAGPVFEPTSV
jgi:hypothetical protein